MRITRLRLSHFRSHRAAELEFDGRPVAVFGPNGAGKTNLIEALSLLSPGRGLRGAAAEDLARAPESIGWKLAAGLMSPDGAHEVVTWSAGAGRSVEIDGKAAPQVALGRVARVLWLTPAMDRLWMEGPAERRRFLDRLVLSLMPDHAEAVLGYDKALKERNYLLREAARDAGWFAALEGRMAERGARMRENRIKALEMLGKMPTGGGFPRADLRLETEGDCTVESFAAGRGRDMAAGRSLVGPHRDDLGAVLAEKGMAARLCSTGEQKALLISVLLSNARAVAEGFGAPPILLLDEVAAHLDAGRRAALYEALALLGAQAFLTGTGPELFAELGDRAARLALSEADGTSRIALV